MENKIIGLGWKIDKPSTSDYTSPFGKTQVDALKLRKRFTPEYSRFVSGYSFALFRK